MKGYTLDKIVRSALFSKQYPMHWYLQFLHYGIECVRELNFDTLQNVKSIRLPINSYKAATLPNDFVDLIRVGNEIGQYLSPWGAKETMNRLNKFDSTGQKVKYGDVEAANGVLPNNWEGFWYTNYVSDKGEHLGRIFNNKPGFRNSFIMLRERNEIQLDTDYIGKEIVMDYITDGLDINASNAIHPYAHKTIVAYILWQLKEHTRSYNSQERQLAKAEYDNQHRILRARMNPIDTIDIERSLKKFYGPVIKK
jgi:hypothetical protein